MTGQPIHTLEVTIEDRVATLRLANPQKRNAIDILTAYAIGDAVTEAAQNPEVRAIIITGDTKAFSAGADLAFEITEDILDSVAHHDPDPDVYPMMPAVEHMILSVIRAKVPVIAAVEGAAAGIGASLAFASDLIIASESAFFLLPFGRIGLIPDGGAINTLAAALGRQATMALALCQDRLPAARAAEVGLVTQLAPAGEAYEAAQQVAAGFRSSPRGALAATKAAVNHATLVGLEDALAQEATTQTELLATPEHAEGVRAFTEKRAPNFD